MYRNGTSCNFNTIAIVRFSRNRVKLGHWGHQVKSDIRLQTVEIQMRRLIMSCLIGIFNVGSLNLFFYSNKIKYEISKVAVRIYLMSEVI